MPQTERVLAVSFQLETADLFRLLFWFNLRKYWIVSLILPICVVSVILSGGRNILLGVAIPLLIWVAVTLLSPYLGARATVRTPNFQGLIRYSFSDSGIDTAAKHSSGHMDWELIDKAVETRRFIVMFVRRNVMYPIPKAALSGDDLAALRTRLKSSVKGKVSLKD
jgi:hypothetical protein